MSKESFKAFVRENPHLINMVHQKEYSWQELYEAYDLYGSNAPIFQKQVDNNIPSNRVNWHEFASLMRNIDLETIQKSVTGLQKAISLIQDISSNKSDPPKTYEERPIYKYYED